MPSELRLSFGNVAELYDRVRLDYSDAAVDRLTEALALEPDADVLDLAAGTGKLTRPLAARFERVVAVEPNAEMRRFIHGVEVLEGTAQRIPLSDSEVDAVFVGDAFHWFAEPAALAEIARVLRPGGGLALVWNHWWETEPAPAEEALELLDARFEESGASRRIQTEDWRDAFPGSAFEAITEEALHERVEVDGSRLVDLYLTTSSFAVMEAGERRELERELRRLVQGRFEIAVRVELAWARR